LDAPVLVASHKCCIAETHPHNAYSAFTHSVRHCWSDVMRTIESVGGFFQPLEEAIHQHFLPALTGRMLSSEVDKTCFCFLADSVD